MLHLYFTLSVVLASRLSFRLLDHIYQRARTSGRGTLIYGAGRAGDLALREILANRDLGLVPVGFVDDEPSLWGRTFDGYGVHPGGAHLGSVLQDLKVQALVISTSKIPPPRLQEIALLCRGAGVRILRFGFLWRDSGKIHLEDVSEGQAEPVRAS